MTRYACLFAQEFPLQALLRLRPELQRKAVAVLDGEPPFEHVCSLNTSCADYRGRARHDQVGNGDVPCRCRIAAFAYGRGSSPRSLAGVCRDLLSTSGRSEQRSMLYLRNRHYWYGNALRFPGYFRRESAQKDAGAWHTSIDCDQLQLSRRQVPGTRSDWRQGGPTGNGMYRRSLLCHSPFSIFLRSTRKPSLCGASRPWEHSETLRRQS